jgi:hypothetical protein
MHPDALDAALLAMVELAEAGEAGAARAVAGLFAEKTPEAAVRNKTGPGWHDDKTGHPVADPSKAPDAGGKTDKQTPPPGERPPAAGTESLLLKAAKAGVAAFKAVGHTAAHYEHVAKEFVTEKIPARLARIESPKLRALCQGLWHALRLGTKVAFATYIAGQTLAHAVAKEAGASEESSARLTGVCTALDLAGAKVIPMTFGAIGLPAVGAAGSFVPIGSAVYLAYSTARRPLAVLRAARTAVKEYRAGGKKAQEAEAPGLGPKAFAAALLAAMDRSADPDAFAALFLAALDETQDAEEALTMAGALDGKTTREAGVSGRAAKNTQEGSPVRNKTGPGWHDSETGHPVPAPGGEAGGSPHPSGGQKAAASAKPPEGRTEDIANRHYQNMGALLAKLKKGEYVPEDVISDADIYLDQTQRRVRQDYRKYRDWLDARVKEKYGEGAFASPEWRAVHRAVRDAAGQAEQQAADMTEVVRLVAEYYRRRPDAGWSWRGTHDEDVFNEAFAKLINSGIRGAQIIAAALDEFKKAHQPGTREAAVWPARSQAASPECRRLKEAIRSRAVNPPTPTSPRRVRECCGAGMGEATVAPGVVTNCKLISRKSTHGYEYTQEALRKAAGLYEGAVVFIDHDSDTPPGTRPKPRPFLSRFGRVVNVREDPEGDGLRFDFKYNPKHLYAPTFEGWVESDPQSVGFSHDALSRMAEQDGKTTAVEVVKVYSVDLVAVPATTRGLRESQVDDIFDTSAASPEAPATEPEAAPESCEDHLIAACTAVLKDAALGTKEKLAKIKDILKVMDGADAGEAPSTLGAKEDGDKGEDKPEGDKDTKEAALPPAWAVELTAAVKAMGEGLKATREAAPAKAEDKKPVSASPTKTDKPSLSVDGLLTALKGGN